MDKQVTLAGPEPLPKRPHTLGSAKEMDGYAPKKHSSWWSSGDTTWWVRGPAEVNLCPSVALGLSLAELLRQPCDGPGAERRPTHFPEIL